MLLIDCPWCGPRNEYEFRYGGPSHIVRPEPYSAVSDTTWAQYLFYRENPKGLHKERWCHTAGCGQWFNLVRNTLDHSIVAVYRLGEKSPLLEKVS